jgi:hypothetical protein
MVTMMMKDIDGEEDEVDKVDTDKDGEEEIYIIKEVLMTDLDNMQKR